jgi:hypothetical protein
VTEPEQLQAGVKPPSVLIVTDDPEFARVLVSRWQGERIVPEITVATSDVWRSGGASRHDLIIVGLICGDRRSSILSLLCSPRNEPAIYVASDESEASALHASCPQLLIVQHRDEWIGMLIPLAHEALRRVEAVSRAHRAERLALESQGHATLGRYMLEMRPNINNALTSVLGNADLLLLEPGQAAEDTREQIQTIHTMTLRLNEIMQRFSSLACEMRAGEKDFQPQVPPTSHSLAARSD